MATDSIKATGYAFDHLDILVIDWETFWGIGYTLRSTPTSEYVRDPRFKSHGVGVYRPRTGERLWLSGDEERDFIASVDWGKTALLAQNMMFDGFILHERYGHHPALYMDTLGMSRATWGLQVPHDLSAIGERCGRGTKETTSDILARTKNIAALEPGDLEEMGLYCLRDVDLTWDCFKHMIEEEQVPRGEITQVDISLRAFCDPKLLVNLPLAQEELDDERTGKARICRQLGVSKDVFHSAVKFADLLRQKGVPKDEIPLKYSPKKDCDIYAFAKSDEGFQELLLHPIAAPYAEARLRIKSTIQETKAARLIKHGSNERGEQIPLPIAVLYWKAHTGRWGGGDSLNPQNFPSGRGRQSQRLRNAMIAPPGYVLIRVDSSQIEPRYAAWLAGDETLLDVFRAKKDPYLHMASDLYQEDFGEDKEKYAFERQLGKVTMISLCYGAGIPRFIGMAKTQFGLELDPALAAWAHGRYRKPGNPILKLWADMDLMLRHMTITREDEDYETRFRDFKSLTFDAQKVWLSNDCAIWYPELQEIDYNYYYRSRRQWVRMYSMKLLENVNQGECRNVVAWQTVPIAERYHVALLAHDEVVAVVPEDEADEAKAFMLACFARTPPWAPDLPVAGKAKIDTCYGK